MPWHLSLPLPQCSTRALVHEAVTELFSRYASSGSSWRACGRPSTDPRARRWGRCSTRRRYRQECARTRTRSHFSYEHGRRCRRNRPVEQIDKLQQPRREWRCRLRSAEVRRLEERGDRNIERAPQCDHVDMSISMRLFVPSSKTGALWCQARGSRFLRMSSMSTAIKLNEPNSSSTRACLATLRSYGARATAAPVYWKHGLPTKKPGRTDNH